MLIQIKRLDPSDVAMSHAIRAIRLWHFVKDGPPIWG
jgi:hypothetical protein